MQLVLPTLSIQRVKPLQIASDSDIDCEESVQSLKTEDAQYDESFTLASSIIEHIETSNEYETGDEVIQQKYVTCSDCDEDECGHYKYLVSYEKQKASGQKKICCPECSYECRQKDLFVAHINEFHLPSIFCEHCSKSLHSIKAYKLHLTHFHSKMLDSNFKFEHNLLKHKEFCNMATKEFLCDECSGLFTSYRKLEYHKLNHHNKRSSFPCPSCDKVFVKLRLLNAHKRVHIEAQMKRRKLYECGICHNTCKTAKERNQHRSTHKPNEKHNCSKCSITFETQSEFMHHMSQEHYETSKPNNLKCPHCDYSTCGKEFLEAHVNRFHLKLSPYACPQCPKKFTNTVKLRTHLKTHDPDKKHSCGTCGKLFCGPVALRKHMRLHTGEKPYKCDFCDKSFICASTRNDHRDRKHKAKSIQCPLCPSKFHTLGMLRAHIKKLHWKQEGKFDVTKVEGLNEEHYELFRDRRLEIF